VETNNNKKDQRKLGEILIEQGIVTKEQLSEALEEQKLSGRFIGEILVSRGVATEEQIARCLSEQLGLAFVDLSDMDIEPRAVKLVSEELCSRYIAIPLFIMQDNLTVAMSNPLDIQAVDEIHSASGCRIKPVFACPAAIRQAIQKQYHGIPASKKTYDSLPSKETDGGTDTYKLKKTSGKTSIREDISIPTSKDTDNQVSSLKQAASLAPVIEMVNNIITKAVEMGASDIHLEPERSNFNCRYRIDGILSSISQISLEYQAAVISRIKIMADMDIAEKRLPQDGRIQIYAAERDVDLRISTFPSIYGENVVMRILDRSGGILKLEQLGFQKEQLKPFSELIRRPYGIILVTGPTGSGKTTTLYGALSEINSEEKNIITLEDPVEYEIPNIRQSQVNVKAGLTFAAGLRSIVRQDPDIIMIGEIRDKETADIAIHAALTGHLVFSTLHTNDAPSAATRLIDMGVEPFLAASSIIGILAQRLVRTLCKSCKEEYVPPKELLKEIGWDTLRNSKSLKFFKETGCPKCNERGYSGRIGIYELLIPNDEIKALITQKAPSTKIREAAVKSGMLTLRQSGLEKVISGTTSVSELLRVTEEV